MPGGRHVEASSCGGACARDGCHVGASCRCDAHCEVISVWAHGLTVSTSAMGHQMLWLLLGGDSPSPRQLQGGYHKALQAALWVQIATPFEAAARTEAERAKKAGGKHDLRAARVAVASRLPWSAPADVPMLRALMTNPAGPAAALGSALRDADPPCAPTPPPPHPPILHAV